MVQSRLIKSAKTLLILLNLNLIIFSFVLIIFGISEKGQIEKYAPLLEGKPSTTDKYNYNPSNTLKGIPSPSNILITLGTITLITGAYGLRSVDNYCHILSYAVFITFLSILDAALGVSASFMEDTAYRGLQSGLLQSLYKVHHISDSSTGDGDIFNGSLIQIHESWDRLQSDLRCCGVYGYEDWKGEGLFKNHAVVGIPGSCFQQGEDAITDEDLNQEDFVQENVFSEGCLSKAVADLGISKVQRVGFILATGKFLGGICASFVAHNIRNNFKAFV